MPRNGSDGEGFTVQLARAVEEVRFDALTDPVVERARQMILDWLGVTIAGSQEPSAGIMRDTALTLGASGACTLVVWGDKVDPLSAAMVNGVASHTLDYDDSALVTLSHPGAPLLAAALPLAEMLDADGRRLVEAVVAGCEVIAQVGVALGWTTYNRGFHVTGVAGALGAAGASARLLGLDTETTTRALSLATTQAAGLKAMFGTMGKHLTVGNAAARGITAAQLAANGFTAPHDAIEGMVAAYASPLDPEAVRHALGGRLGIELTHFKRHACCGALHSLVDGVAEIRRERPFTANELDDVRVAVSAPVTVAADIRNATTGLEGKFSAQYTVALALAGRDTGPDSFTDSAVGDSEVTALYDLIEIETDPELPTEDLVGEVTIRFAGGDVRSARAVSSDPVADADLAGLTTALQSKFRQLVAPVLGSERADRLVSTVAAAESLSSAAALMADTVGSREHMDRPA